MDTVKTEYKNKNAKSIIKNSILDLFKDKNKYDNIVVLCIGTNKSGGSSMAPFVGTFLDKKINSPVFGTLEKTISACNLKETLKIINEKYKNPYIIAVTGQLCNDEKNIGNISIIDGSVTLGKGVINSPEVIGDISITGTINSFGEDAFKSIQSANMYIVFELAKAIANGIIDALYEL